MYTQLIGMTSVQRRKIDFFVQKGSKSQDNGEKEREISSNTAVFSKHVFDQ